MADIVSVAYVVDASLALASEWHQVLAEYLLPLLQRLAEAHTNPQFRLGVVSYGPAETIPTPLLGRHFFAPPQAVMKELREKPEAMGLGLTSSGEPTGMAALEGLVAAVEFFDMYGDALPNMTSHIIHIAAVPPDGSEHPVWNTASALDNLSWSSLPGELKKRNIHYSTVLLRPLPRFSQLYTSASAGSVQQPWFPTRPQHVLHINGFPQMGAKHAPEGTTAARPTEPKRLKTEAHSSPPQQLPNSSPPLSHAPPPTTAPPQTQTQVPAQPSRPVPPLSAAPRDYLMQLQAHILKKKQEVQELDKMGQTKEAEAGHKELNKLVMLFRQTQIHLSRQQAQQGRSIVASQSQPVNFNNGGGSGPDNGSAGAAAMQESTSVPVLNGSAASNNTNAQVEAQPDRSGEPSQPLYLEPNPISTSAGHLSLGQNNATVLAINVPPPELPQSSPAMSNAQASRAPGQPQPEYTRVWEGNVTWVDPASRRQLHANAAINGPEMMRGFVWPQTLTLDPSPDYRVNMPKLQEWLKEHSANCQVVFAQLHGSLNDPKQPEHVWQSITASHRYPIVSFPDASGQPVNRLLFFPVRPMQFVGAFFTSPAGVPARPQLVIGGIETNKLPPTLANLLLNLNPQQTSELEKLDLKRKQEKIQEYLQGYRLKAEQQRLLMLKAQVQAQQNQQAQASHMSQSQGAPPTADGMITPSTMVSQPPMQQQQQPAMSTQQRVSVAPNNLNTMIPMNPFINGLPPTMEQMLALGGSKPQGGLTRVPSGQLNPMAGLPNGMGMQGMHQRVPSGGGGMNINSGVNLSQEMMQSFMQRRQDGSGGMGGMGGAMGGGSMGM